MMNAHDARFIDLSTTSAFAIVPSPREYSSIANRVPDDLAIHYIGSSNAVHHRRLPRTVPIDNESERWQTFLAGLAHDESLATQRSAFLELLQRVAARGPATRRPAVGRTTDGHLHVGWRFVDLPGLTFTVEILPDGSVEWFFECVAEGIVDGSDDPVPRVPDGAIDRLVTAFGGHGRSG